MIVLAIIATLAAIVVPAYGVYLDKARVIQAIADIHRISTDIAAYRADQEALPGSLADIGYGALRDPWGRPYRYVNIEANKGFGGLRKDKFLVPLNSDYDLYSMGKDGQSRGPLSALVSHDDIIRANNGGYIGLAAAY
jgi:general secretion pathway protein G